MAKKDTAAKDLKEFLAYLKANSDKLSYGHAGVGSISHVSGTVFNAQFGLKPALVAYRGTAPALNDLVGGQIDYMVDQSLNVIPQIKGGTIKVYAVAASARLESIPDVPTTKEAGVDFIFSAWNAMVAPKGTPKAIVDKLVGRTQQGARRPQHHQALRRARQHGTAGGRSRSCRSAEAGRERDGAHHAGAEGGDGGRAA